MINPYTLQFKDDQIRLKYIQQKKQSILHNLAALILFLLIIDGIKLFDRRLPTSLLSDIGYSCLGGFQIIGYCFLRRNHLKVDQFIVLLEIAYTILFVLNIEEDNKETVIQNFSYGYYICFISYLFYYSTTDFLISTALFVLINFSLIYSLPYTLENIMIILLVNLGLIIIKYFAERQKRKKFLLKQFNQQWDNIVDEVLNLWIIAITFNPITNQIEIHHANNNFKNTFGIKDIYDFKNLLRKLVSFNSQNQQINLEQKIEQIIVSQDNQMNLQVFVAQYQKEYVDSQSKTRFSDKFTKRTKFIIKLQKVVSEISQVIMIIEKQEDYSHIQKKQIILSFLIGYFHWVNDLTIKMYAQIIKHLNIIHEKYKIQDNQLIQGLYQQFNIFLNTKLIFDIQSNSHKIIQLKIIQIEIDSCLDNFAIQLGIKIINRSEITTIQSDFSKFTQLLITFIDFTKHLLKIQNAPNLGQMQIYIVKQNDKILNICIYHPELRDHPQILDLFEVLHFKSEINKLKFGDQQRDKQQQMKKIVNKIISYQQSIFTNNQDQLIQELFQYIVSLSYLLTTLGPHCQIKISKTQNLIGSIIKVSIYQNLKEVQEIVLKE